MDADRLPPSRRRTVAAEAWAALGPDRRERVLLRVRCSRSHHVAAVYATPAGPVYATELGRHAHGHRDFVDVDHRPVSHGRVGRYHLDLLEPFDPADDALPATCECGPRTLSRADLLSALRESRRTIEVP